MRIMLANQYLQPVAELLTEMPLKASQSRARSKLLTLVTQALARFGEDEYALVAEYAARDDQGNPVLDADGTFRLADPEQAGEFDVAVAHSGADHRHAEEDPEGEDSGNPGS